MPQFQREVLKQEMKKMLQDGVIEPSYSEESSPVVLMKKGRRMEVLH